jgi:uncharacterized membrane protein YdfJ with MMPL/SSD domain
LLSQARAVLPAFLVVIVGLALVLLMLAFRSLAVPVKAVLGFLLTIAAALGAVTWTFQEGHLSGLLGIAAPSPVVSFLPVLLIAILFGLAMVLALLGARAWTLPAWLDRHLPHVDIEGGPAAAPVDNNRARVARDPYA